MSIKLKEIETNFDLIITDSGIELTLSVSKYLVSLIKKILIPTLEVSRDINIRGKSFQLIYMEKEFEEFHYRDTIVNLLYTANITNSNHATVIVDSILDVDVIKKAIEDEVYTLLTYLKVKENENRS